MNETTTTTNASAATTAQPINTVARCIEVAAPMFADPAVHSVNVLATFGEVRVHRTGIVTSTSI